MSVFVEHYVASDLMESVWICNIKTYLAEFFFYSFHVAQFDSFCVASLKDVNKAPLSHPLNTGLLCFADVNIRGATVVKVVPSLMASKTVTINHLH